MCGVQVDVSGRSGIELLGKACKERDGYVAWACVKAGVPVDVTVDAHGNTPLILAASHGSLVVTDSILSVKGDVNRTNKTGVTCLMAAVRRWVPSY